MTKKEKNNFNSVNQCVLLQLKNLCVICSSIIYYEEHTGNVQLLQAYLKSVISSIIHSLTKHYQP